MAKEKKSVGEVILALQAGARQYKAFKEGVELAEVVKSLESSQKELEGVLPKLQEEKQNLSASIKSLKKKEDDLNKTVLEAKDKAKDAVAEKAKEILAQAQGKADDIITKAQVEESKARDGLSLLNVDIAEKQAVLKSLVADIDKAEKAKAKILSSLGG